MATIKKKVSELPLATSTDGLDMLGADSVSNENVRVPFSLIKAESNTTDLYCDGSYDDVGFPDLTTLKAAFIAMMQRVTGTTKIVFSNDEIAAVMNKAKAMDIITGGDYSAKYKCISYTDARTMDSELWFTYISTSKLHRIVIISGTDSFELDSNSLI